MLFALFKPAILKLPRVSLYYIALSSPSAAWTCCRGDWWAECPEPACFLPAQLQNNSLRGRGALSRACARISSGTAFCSMWFPCSGWIPWGRSASSVLISRATLCCNLSFTRRRKGKNMKLQNSYPRLMCVMCVYRYYKTEFSSIASCPYSLCPVSFNLTQFLMPSATLCRLSGDKG